MGHARARGGCVRAFLRQEAANLLTTLGVVVILGGVALNQHLTSATEGGMSYPSGGEMHYDGGGSYQPSGGSYDQYNSTYDGGGSYQPSGGSYDQSTYDGQYHDSTYYDQFKDSGFYDQFKDSGFQYSDYNQYKDSGFQYSDYEKYKDSGFQYSDGFHEWEGGGFHSAPSGGGECTPGEFQDDGCGGGCSCQNFDGQGFWLCTMQVCDIGGVGAAGGGGDGGGVGGIPVACIDVQRMAQEMHRGAEGEAPGMIAEVQNKNADVAGGMEQLRQDTLAALAEVDAAINNSQCGVAAQKLDELHTTVNSRLSALWSQLGGDFGDFDMEHPVIGDLGDQYKDFYAEHEDDFMQFFSKDEFAGIMRDKGYTATDLSAIRMVNPEDVGQYFEHSTAGMDIIKYATDTHTISTDDLQKLIAIRNSLIAEIEGLQGELASWQKKMASTMAQYHFGPDTASVAEKFMIEELADLSPAEAQAQLDEILEAGTEEKFDNNWIPFADLDPDRLTEDQQWYVEPIVDAKALGILEGTGESDGKLIEADREVNYAEIAKIVAETLPGEIDLSAVPTSDFGQKCPDWAKPYVAALEEEINVDRIVGNVAPSDPATRADVFELFAVAHDLGTADIGVVNYYEDSGDANGPELKAAAELVDAGIVAGYGGTNELGFDDTIDRAATAKIAVEVVEATQGEVEHTAAPEEETPAPTEAPAEPAVSDAEVHDLLEDLGDLKQEVREAREEQPRDADVVDLQQDIYHLGDTIDEHIDSGEPVTPEQYEMWTDSLHEIEGTFEGTSTGTYEKPTRRSLLEDLQSLLWPF